jgi:adenylate cyclase
MRKLYAGVLLGVGAAGLVLLIGALGGFNTAELKAYDWRVRRTAKPANASRDIVLVEINDTSIRDLATLAGRWPWPRVLLASVIDFIARGRPKAIAVDLTITEPDLREGFPFGGDKWSGAESDAALVDSIRKAGTVVMLAEANYQGSLEAEQKNAPAAWKPAPYRLGPVIEARRLIVPPFQAITDAAASLGHNFIALDEDGPARRIVPFVRHGDRYMPSLGVAAGLVGAGVRPEEVVLDGRAIRIGADRVMPLVPIRVKNVEDAATHEQLTALINYRAPVLDFATRRRPYTSFEVRHVLLSEEEMAAGQKPTIDPAQFKDKIVFVGLTASGLLDVFNTPFGEGVMPGIQIHASVADSIISNRFIRPAPAGSRVAAAVGLAIAVGLMSAALPFTIATIGALLAASFWTWAALAAFGRGLWLDMTQPIAAIAIALFAGTAYRYFVEERQKRVVKKLFGRYVSRDVYQQLIANPDLAELGGARREMTVLFSDIRGFTTVTEKGDPEALVAQLNEYFTRMVELVFAHHGTVDKFVGDMVMALFGAPLEDAGHADHAVQTAVAMVAELGRLNERWAAEGRAQLDIGVGINSGEMIAGNIGSSSIMSYTVIGDNVNLGSRLESLNKEYGTRIIISDATRTRLKQSYDMRPLGDALVKGKTIPVAIFEVVVPAPLQTARSSSAAL